MFNFSTGNEYADSIFSDISKKFINDTLQRNNLVYSSKPQAGNLSEEQLKQGQSGGLPTPASANNVGVLNSLGVNFSGNNKMMWIVGGVLVLGIAYFALRK